MMAATFSKVKSIALSQVGTSENPPYSNRTKYGAWYGWNGVFWCDIFLSWVFSSAGWIDGHKGKSASVALTRQRFQAAGRYGKTPRVGALAVFWGDEHIELVLSVGPTTVYTVGGNTSAGDGSVSNGGTVAAKYRSRSLIMGYCYPAYASPAPASSIPTIGSKSTVSGRFPLPAGHYYGVNDGSNWSHSGYRGGVDRTNVTKIQRELGVVADGQYGPKTRAAVKKWQQKKRLEVDGRVGPNTWKSFI